MPMVFSGVAAGSAAPTAVRGTFVDDDGNPHEGMIEAIAGAGITRGCSADGPRFCPSDAVLRGQVASFLARALALPAAEVDAFDDDAGSIHEDSINRLAAAGIARGRPGGRFEPAVGLTRAQLATLLVRAFDLPPASADVTFVDVSAGNIHADSIERVAAAGITRGCDAAGIRFCPDATVSRGQLASLLGRALGLSPVDLDAPPPGDGQRRQDPGGPGDDPDPDDELDLSESAFRPGSLITIRGSGFKANSVVTIVMFSEPVELGTADVDSSGDFSAEVVIPELEDGEHLIEVSGEDPTGAERKISRTVSVDRVGPDITSVTVAPLTVSPGDVFTITIAATDVTGVEYVGFYFNLEGLGQRDFCGQQTEFNEGTGNWTATCTVPDLVLNGEYEIVPYAEDLLGNFTNTNCCSTSETRGAFTVENGSDDRDGPAITSVTVAPLTVSPGDVFTITIAATDVTGVKSVGFYFNLEGLGQRDFCGQQTEFNEGTGNWTATCTVPEEVIGGTYEIVPVAEDLLGNFTNTNCCSESPMRGWFVVTESGNG
jgi:hypothetical protein